MGGQENIKYYICLNIYYFKNNQINNQHLFFDIYNN